MAMIFKAYPVVNDAFKGNGFNIRFAGNDTDPLFVAKDIYIAMGHKYCGNCHSFYEKLPGRTEVDKGSIRGNRIMVAITKEDVSLALSKPEANLSDDYKKQRQEFRKFWKNEVLPQIEHPEIRGKIVALENQNSSLEEENARLKAEIALLRGTGFTPEAS